jgi:hypothetical protein
MYSKIRNLYAYRFRNIYIYIFLKIVLEDFFLLKNK